MKSSGLHIIADFKNCLCSPTILIDEEKAWVWFSNIIIESELKALDMIFHSFGKDMGYTGLILLAESHISIHTWPNLDDEGSNIVQVDIFVCNYMSDNTDKAKYVFNALENLLVPNSKLSKIKFITRC